MSAYYLEEKKDNGAVIKTAIIMLCLRYGELTIAEMSKDILASTPTVTKFVNTLVSEGYLIKLGKMNADEGRRPNLYGINPLAGYIVGIDIRDNHLNLVIVDFRGKQLYFKPFIPFVLDTSSSSGKELDRIIREQVRESGTDWNRIIHIGISIIGPTNPEDGLNAYYYVSKDNSFSHYMSQITGIPVIMENVTRAKLAAELRYGKHKDMNVVFVNLDKELGIGVLSEGKLISGHKGYAGNAGHMRGYGSSVRCRCGKVGCLSTLASGDALHRMYLSALDEGKRGFLLERYQAGEAIGYPDVREALMDGDPLALSITEKMGHALGNTVASCVNMYDPKYVIIGGEIAINGFRLLEALREEVGLSIDAKLYDEVEIHLTSVSMTGAALGACVIAQRHFLGMHVPKIIY